MFSVCFCAYTGLKEIKNYPERVPNIKPFLDLYSSKDIQCSSVIGKNNYILLEKLLINCVLCYNVNVEIVKVGKGSCANIHKSIKQSHVSSHYYERVKTAVLLSIPDDISIKEEICKEINIKLNFCDMAELIKTNIYYKDDNKNYVFIKKLKQKSSKSY